MTADLRAALKARDTRAVRVLRTALAAVANAEAVDPADHRGATEVERRLLTDDDVRGILAAEVAEMRAVADDLHRRGREDDAADLEGRAAVLAPYLVAPG
jgi:uncharacterized protein YqeY